jgi:P63C domain
MNTAQEIVQKFGGQSSLAKLLGKRQSMVQYWTKTGTIPAKWQPELLAVAQENGIELLPSDFIAMSVQVPSPPSGNKTEPRVRRVPEAKWFGALEIGQAELPCYVLDDGRRVISRTGATSVLVGKKGGGQLEKYVSAESFKSYVPPGFSDRMIDFSIKGVENKTVRGIAAEDFLDLCRGLVKAWTEDKLQTQNQRSMALQASAVLSACAKVGLIALIDEATGAQYERADDALRVKLKAYLEEEMRKWEKTFPDELWLEFGRLTNWTGSVTSRPKYWGKLVMELVYEYLDKDVADWLKKNAPQPRGGQNYHQWLSSQYGLKKLIEHLWMLIGMARACKKMSQLREKMAETYGRQRVQVTVFVPPPSGQGLLPFMEPPVAPDKTGTK